MYSLQRPNAVRRRGLKSSVTTSWIFNTMRGLFKSRSIAPRRGRKPNRGGIKYMQQDRQAPIVGQAFLNINILHLNSQHPITQQMHLLESLIAAFSPGFGPGRSVHRADHLLRVPWIHTLVPLKLRSDQSAHLARPGSKTPSAKSATAVSQALPLIGYQTRE